MKALIKEIRKRLGYSQEELSTELGVSSITINRWENGRAIPYPLAQKQIYELCLKNNLDMADYIIDRYRYANEGFCLYHASRNGIVGAIKPISRKRCDFGKGFYMGTDPLQPLTLVCDEEEPVFYTVSLNLDGLKVLSIDIDSDWAMIIAYFRGYLDEFKDSKAYEKYKNMVQGYDVIAGYIADDRMYQVLTDFFNKRITDTALIKSLSALKLGKQYVAITEKACDSVKILNERKINDLELMFLKEKNIERRNEGIRLSFEAVIEHRRDGRYFDEILKEAS